MVGYLFSVGLCVLIIVLWFRRRQGRTKTPATLVESPSVLTSITPVDANFDWKRCFEPEYRPFVNKKNFNPSMGVKKMNNDASDWLRIEHTYLEEIFRKKVLMKERPEDMAFCSEGNVYWLALAEFYDVVMSFYVQRYPQYFQVKEDMVYNFITERHLPLTSDGLNSSEMLANLNETMEEDFLILMKDAPDDPDGEYILRAALNAAPAGFDPTRGHNQPVSLIHSPVPQYQLRLKHSMGKFFTNMLLKDLWVRFNWSIQTHPTRFNLNQLHGREGDALREIPKDELPFDDCRLRVERQTFTRLPRTKAMIMIIRTYLTPISKICAEGNGPELIRGIDSLPDDLAFYKRRGEWGEALKAHVREWETKHPQIIT